MRCALPILAAAAAVSLGCIGCVAAATSRGTLRHEVLVEVASSASPRTVSALQRRHRLRRIEQRTFHLAGTTLYRWRIPDSRSVATVVRSLQGDAAVTSAQPNYLFTLEDAGSNAASRSNAHSWMVRR
jgi:hypothetical protein